MAFNTEMKPTGKQRTARRFRWLITAILCIAALAVLAQYGLMKLWNREPQAETIDPKPAASYMPNYHVPEPAPALDQAAVTVVKETPPPEKEWNPPPPPQRYEEGRKPERLSAVAWNIQEQDIGADWYRDGRREMLGQGCALRPGVSIIPAKLITAVNSEIAGQVIAEVMTPVYSPDRGYENKVLVPAGTRVVGLLDKGERGLTFDRSRVDIAWTEMTSPSGFGGDLSVTQVALGRAFDASADGSSGSGGVVEMRWGELFAYAALTTIFNAAQRSAIDSENVVIDSVSRETGNTIGDVGNTVLERTLDWEPRISIAAGTQVRILIDDTIQVCG